MNTSWDLNIAVYHILASTGDELSILIPSNFFHTLRFLHFRSTGLWVLLFFTEERSNPKSFLATYFLTFHMRISTISSLSICCIVNDSSNRYSFFDL